MKTNKLTRELNRKKVLSRRLRKFGFTFEPDITIVIVKEVQNTGGHARKQMSERKTFSKSPRKGYHRPYKSTHLGPKQLKAREQLRSAWEDSGLRPMTNNEQRELNKYSKKPKKNLNGQQNGYQSILSPQPRSVLNEMWFAKFGFDIL